MATRNYLLLGTIDTYPIAKMENPKDSEVPKFINSYFSSTYKNWKIIKKPDVKEITLRRTHQSQNGSYEAIFRSLDHNFKSLAVDDDLISKVFYSMDEISKEIRSSVNFEKNWLHFLIEAEVNGAREFFIFRNIDYSGKNKFKFSIYPFTIKDIWFGICQYYFGVAV